MAIVLGQLDAAWPLANFDGPDGFHLVGVYHANGVALLVRNIGGKSVRWSSKADNDCKSEQTRALFAHWYAQTGFSLRANLLQTALRLWTVIAECIKCRELVQEACLRRD